VLNDLQLNQAYDDAAHRDEHEQHHPFVAFPEFTYFPAR
jgi:hypothetical protein